MAAKRQNSSKVLAQVSPMSLGDSSTSVEKISNGYLIRKSQYNAGTGVYSSETRYSKGPNGSRDAGCESLRDAMDYLGDKK